MHNETTICILKKPFLHFLAVFLLVAIPAGPARGAEIVDDLGRKVSVNETAKRIIPLYGAFAEMLYSMGAGPALLARTQADQFPEEILKLPSVGTHMKPNVEMIIGLKPDLVIQSASRRETAVEMESLYRTGIPVAVFSPNSFQGVFSTMTRLGILTGREKEASAAVSQLQKRLENVKARLEGVQKRPTVFFEVRAEPLAGAGQDSMVQDILLAAGAENIVRKNKSIVQYSFEALLALDPDVYIVQRGPMNRNPLDPKQRAHFEQLRCVRSGKIIFVDEFLFSRPGPRCMDAVEQLAAALYPGKP